MYITHDKESGALYIRLREGEYRFTEDLSEGADVFADVDAEGNVLGVEALSLEDLAQTIDERGGRLELSRPLGPEAGGAPCSSATPGAGQAQDAVGDDVGHAQEAAGRAADQAGQAAWQTGEQGSQTAQDPQQQGDHEWHSRERRTRR